MKVDEERWAVMQGGYRVPFDPRPLLLRLEAGPEDDPCWDSLFEELYHQGDVGESSYVAVVLLSESAALMRVLPWQMLSLVAAIELARTESKNPPVPEWLAQDYQAALRGLATASLRVIAETDSPERLRGSFALVLLAKGLRIYASAIEEYSEEELGELLP